VSETASPRLQLGRVGDSTPRVDGVPKVTGEFAYSSDLQAAGMLWGHTLRSPHAHARIVSIDISEAVGMPGVHAVLTHEDVPGEKRYGLEFPDQPVLAYERVRYFGEPVALVAAEHPEQARRAAARIRVEYEELELVVDPERATEQDPLHPDRPTMGHGYRDDPRPNIVRSLVIRHGDFDAGSRLLRAAIDELDQREFALFRPEFLCALGEVLADTGRIAEGRDAIHDGLKRCERDEELWCIAELLRVKGELELRLHSSATSSTAEDYLLQSIDWARRQNALSWELRAAMSLSRLWQQQGKRADAYALLEPVYAWFTEGFDTADLQEARALLEVLA
jgi:plasmid stabilization system protein ParE